MRTSHTAALLTVAIAATLSACSSDKVPAEAPRTVRTVEVRYDASRETYRYFGTVHSRHEVDQAFRVGGKVAERKVDVGDTVREGDVLAVLDDNDYRLAVETASQQLVAATTQARQAESDRRRLDALKLDGSVSESDDERAQSAARTAAAAEAAQARALELARNRLKYTVLRASRSGVVTSLQFEVGQVVAEGQPIISIANPGEPEIAVDVPEDHLAAFKASRFQASLASSPGETFEVVLRELSPQAAAQTRTYRARLKPKTPRAMPLGATATLVVERGRRERRSQRSRRARSRKPPGSPRCGSSVMRVPSRSERSTWYVLPYTDTATTRCSFPARRPVTLIVTAGVQKMSPGLRVALAGTGHRQAAK